MSLYQEFRPKSFEDVAGQDAAVAYLQNIIKKSNSNEVIPHAYIFFGGHGIGKTTLARIFAKQLGTDEADVYELDAASTRGIDGAREIIDGMYTLPLLSKFKVYILDEAHQLTKEASSAFLKSFEEPPAHVIFMLCTTHAEKLLPTVRSRCQMIELKVPNVEQLSERLEYIVKEKKFNLKREAVEIISKHSNNSFRDAVSNLESVMNSYSEVNLENVKNYFGENQFDLEMAMLRALSSKDKDTSIKDIFSILKDVKNFDNFYQNILEYLRIGLQARFDESLKIDKVDILKLDSKSKIFSEILKESPALFTSKNLLYLLEKSNLINKNSDKHMMSIAIFCSFLEI